MSKKILLGQSSSRFATSLSRGFAQKMADEAQINKLVADDVV